MKWSFINNKLLIQSFVFGVLYMFSSVVAADGPIGFASLDGGTTGGKGGKVISVSDKAAFADAVKGSEARIVEISGKITLDYNKLTIVGSNISIIGKRGAIIMYGGLHLKGSKNVIIKNIIFQDPAGNHSAAVKMDDQAQNIWIDHCNLTAMPRQKISDRTHGHTIHVEGGAKNITISYCYFHHFVHNVIFCPNPAHDAIDANTTITIHDCWFDGTWSRNPRTRSGRFHIFNTYYLKNNWSKKTSEEGYAIVANDGSRVVVENTVFEDVHNPVILGFKGHPKGSITLKDCEYKNVGNTPQNSGTTFDPKSLYKYTLVDVAKVPEHVKKYAGAGKPQPTSIESILSKKITKKDISISIVNSNKLIIKNIFSNNSFEGTFTIYSLSGKKLTQYNLINKKGEKTATLTLPEKIGSGNYYYRFVNNKDAYSGALQLK